MRDHLLETLSATTYRRFPVFLLGPYEAHDAPDEDVFGFLERVRDGLRERGFNAFLATDADVPTSQVDAGTRTVAFARASNAIVFVVPFEGRNLGVGIEAGAVLESARDRARHRVLFLHDVGVESAMIASVGERWDAAVRTFEDEGEAVDEARLFVRDVMRRETTGDLPFPPE